MRALCGAIISAGALIGLGLTALGFGIRFQPTAIQENATPHEHAFYGTPSMTICLVVLLICVGIGIGLAFLGLMFHHHRRHHEHLREFGHTPGTRATP